MVKFFVGFDSPRSAFFLCGSKYSPQNLRVLYCLNLEDKTDSYPETSVITKQRCVTCQKSEYLIYTEAEV